MLLIHKLVIKIFPSVWGTLPMTSYDQVLYAARIRTPGIELAHSCVGNGEKSWACRDGSKG